MAGCLLLVTAGCGGDPATEYCGRLQADRVRFADMLESQQPTALIDRLPMLHRLGDAAPPDLADEWQTLLNAVEGLRDALRRAHVDPGVFDGGHQPAGLSGAQRRAVADAASELSSPGVTEAANGIEQQARDVCKIDLGL